MKKGVRTVSVIHTSYVIFMVAVFLRYNSFIHIPAILKGILVAYTIVTLGCIFIRVMYYWFAHFVINHSVHR